MAKLTKKQKATAAIVDSHKFYDVDEAVKLLKEAATAKFDETVELAAAQRFFLMVQANPRKFSYLPKTRRKKMPKQPAPTMWAEKNWRTKLPRAGWILT